VATSALRYYEEEGLIHSERTDSGHRRYPREVIRRVAFIVFAQRIGLSLSEIRVELARLPRNRVPSDRTGPGFPTAGKRASRSALPSSSASATA
jgi:MerR family redox-sensitive transcriptional activator SoxR